MKKVLFLTLIAFRLYGAASSSDGNEDSSWSVIEEGLKAGYEKDSYAAAKNAMVAQSWPSQDNQLLISSASESDNVPQEMPGAPRSFKNTLRESLQDPNSDWRRILDQNEGAQAANGVRKVLRDIWSKEFGPIKPFHPLHMDKLYEYFRLRGRIEAFAKDPGNVLMLIATANNYPENMNYRTMVEEVEDIQNDRITERELVSQVDNVNKDSNYVKHLLSTATFVPRFARSHRVRPTEASEFIRKALVQGLDRYKDVPDFQKKADEIRSLQKLS